MLLSSADSQRSTHNPPNKECNMFKVTSKVIVDLEMCVKSMLSANKTSKIQCVQKCSKMVEVILQCNQKILFTLNLMDYAHGKEWDWDRYREWYGEWYWTNGS